ncbi:TPA: tail fiber assembly protein [Yersinia enterocolitica]|nr:phage tail protein [Yersinia enterocolitica]HDX5738248.1 phage tail protein [Yersinia enterocolitica]HED0390813.1 phage tail protein [Yersinia enterocolitica]
MSYLYSASTNSFYPSELVDVYKAANSFPEDTIDVDDGVYIEFSASAAPVGKVRAAGKKGLPVWGDIIQPILDADELAAKARHYRNAFIIATDPMMVSDYSIDDKPLTEAQRSELAITRAAYRAWPTVTGWPLVELPELPQWLLIEAVNQGYRVPVWPELPDVA